MKKNIWLVVTIFLGLLLVPSQGIAQRPFPGEDIRTEDQHRGLQQLIDSAGVKGVVLVFDAQKGVLYSNDLQRGRLLHLPASTFKIPNSIIALETGVVQDETTLFAWDGKPRSLSWWERDMSFREAFRHSCVPCYQQVAAAVGADSMNHWLELLGYGTMEVTPENITTFWLEGNSRISPLEQLGFMIRLYYSQLPVTDRTYQVIRQMMVIEEHPQWRLSGKTGWAIRQNNNTGWFTGYLEKQEQVCFVVTCIEPGEKFDMEMFNMVRQKISMEALKLLKIIET